MTTGLALIGSFACCFEARRVALKLSQAQDFEAMKLRAINDDVEDELATSAYISEQQRRMEAESILNAGSGNVEQLERALALTHGGDDDWSEERSEKLAKSDDSERLERILQLQAKGYGKAKIILEIWGASKGGSQKYKDAEAQYDRIIGGKND